MCIRTKKQRKGVVNKPFVSPLNEKSSRSDFGKSFVKIDQPTPKTAPNIEMVDMSLKKNGENTNRNDLTPTSVQGELNKTAGIRQGEEKSNAANMVAMTEVFENCAQATTFNPINITQIFSQAPSRAEGGIKRDWNDDTLEGVDGEIIDCILPSLEIMVEKEVKRMVPIEEHTCISEKRVPPKGTRRIRIGANPLHSLNVGVKTSSEEIEDVHPQPQQQAVAAQQEKNKDKQQRGSPDRDSGRHLPEPKLPSPLNTLNLQQQPAATATVPQAQAQTKGGFISVHNNLPDALPLPMASTRKGSPHAKSPKGKGSAEQFKRKGAPAERPVLVIRNGEPIFTDNSDDNGSEPEQQQGAQQPAAPQQTQQIQQQQQAQMAKTATPRKRSKRQHAPKPIAMVAPSVKAHSKEAPPKRGKDINKTMRDERKTTDNRGSIERLPRSRDVSHEGMVKTDKGSTEGANLIRPKRQASLIQNILMGDNK